MKVTARGHVWARVPRVGGSSCYVAAAITGAFGRRVAIDLGQPVLDAVFVALHEETRAVSDALSVPDRAARLRRDTLRGAPGADVHATLEAAAVVVAAARGVDVSSRYQS